jgi:hypothetical protein
MVFLRSEEHLAQWLAQSGYEPGATLPTPRLDELARRWWGSRLDADWVPRSRDDSQAILDGLGLTGPFWRLP